LEKGLSVKLRVSDRAEIIKKALEKGFSKELSRLARDEDSLARKCYNSSLPLKERRTAAELPKKWLERGNSLKFNVGGENHTLCLLKDETLPVPSGPSNYYEPVGIVKDPELIKQVAQFRACEEDFKTRRKAAETTLTALLNSVSTLGQLKKIWPEGAPFWAEIDFEERLRGLPVPQLDTLNTVLGLKAA
jgi:hypothetical protein